jgi:hypothetical protein
MGDGWEAPTQPQQLFVLSKPRDVLALPKRRKKSLLVYI